MSVSKKKLFLFLIRHRRIVSGFPKQTVVRQGSSVFCIRKSSVAERERMQSLERNELVYGECPTLIRILMENLCLYVFLNRADEFVSDLLAQPGRFNNFDVGKP